MVHIYLDSFTLQINTEYTLEYIYLSVRATVGHKFEY